MICENYRKGGSVRELAKKFWEAQTAVRSWASIQSWILRCGFSFNLDVWTVLTVLRTAWGSPNTREADEV